jgi:hypothetical protein
MVPESRLVETRRSLHGVAELVLAGTQYTQTREISLRALPGGFGTTHTPDLRVDGTDVVGAEATVGIAGRTPSSMAEALGFEATSLDQVYAGGSGVGVDDVLEVDQDAAVVIAGAFAMGDAALRALAPEETPILWPEHFDIGISVDEVNYGVSPGDTHLPEPYAYVGPWKSRTGPFWDHPFGAARPLSELPGVDGVVTFFRDGAARAAADPQVVAD